MTDGDPDSIAANLPQVSLINYQVTGVAGTEEEMTSMERWDYIKIKHFRVIRSRGDDIGSEC